MLPILVDHRRATARPLTGGEPRAGALTTPSGVATIPPCWPRPDRPRRINGRTDPSGRRSSGDGMSCAVGAAAVDWWSIARVPSDPWVRSRLGERLRPSPATPIARPQHGAAARRRS
jgi:hypothetical protein